ncbi:hypothetical protein FB451DRAFT_696058 [Mycena latifolia]|nr:hypothetical protein FB451DRAFT_696058 [Mycena latifolia]
MMLPQELMNMILEDVKASGDPHETLKSISLVAHRFRVPIQRHLFRALTVQPWTIEGLSSSLNDAPRLASYVLDLTIDFNIGERGARLGVRDNDLELALVSLFTVLRSVERLRFPPWSAWTADSLAEDLRSAFVGFLSLPSLQALLFVEEDRQFIAASNKRGIPASLLVHALSSYKEVVLSPPLNIHHDERFIPIRAPPSPPTLQTLDVHLNITNVVLDLLLSPALAELSIVHLKMSAFPDSLRRCAGLRCIRNLQHLELRFLAPYEGRPVELPTIPHLQRLTLRAFVRVLAVPNILMNTIARLPTRVPRIEVIVVALSINREFELRSEVDAAPAPTTDATLAELEHLHAATFFINVGPTAMELFARSMETRLPRAQAAGRIAFVSAVD